MSDAQGDEKTWRQIVATLADAFASSAAASATKNLAISPPSRGSWSAVGDCEDISRATELPALLGDPPFVAFRGDGMAEVAEGRTAAIASGGVSNCVWEGGERRRFTMKALPGGAWAEKELRQTGTAENASVPGAQSSFFLVREGVGANLEVFAEGNWMELH